MVTTNEQDTLRRLESLATAFKTVPFGGVDDAALDLDLPPSARATISPVINSARWGALMVGMVFEMTKAIGNQQMSIVAAVTVCLFLTSFRTVIPIRLGSTEPKHQAMALGDVAVLGISVGFGGGTSSAFVYAVIVAIGVAAFGWGHLRGVQAAVVAIATIAIGQFFERGTDGIVGPESIWRETGSAWQLAISIAVVLGAATVRQRLLEAEQRRKTLEGQLESLSETNDLLSMLNGIARTLPMSLNQREAIDGASRQLHETFDPAVICLLELDETNDEWAPKLAEGIVSAPSLPLDNLAPALRAVHESSEPLLITDFATSELGPLGSGSQSGLYCRLEARDRTIGLLGLEHPEAGHYRERDTRLLTGLAEVLALTLDNARWFGRLRSLGAEEERIRIARDLHDRVGQWLTYIGFELERILADGQSESPELQQLYRDVTTALDELRETLRQLRSGVSESRTLEIVGAELVERFRDRATFEIDYLVGHPGGSLPVPIENELLRILQEALNNADKHSSASRVEVRYDVADSAGVLRIRDDGVGFDANRGVRDSAYGLVGMRERADSIGARLAIESEPGKGTTITVSAGTRMPDQNGTQPALNSDQPSEVVSNA